MRAFLVGSAVLAALGIVHLGCGGAESTGSSSGQADAGDDRFRPAGDGTRISEADACALLVGAQGMRRLALSCAGTSRVCPDALRTDFGAECLEYDQGSVKGCIAYYGEAKTCEDLSQAIDKCAITAFAGSQPNGCPAP